MKRPAKLTALMTSLAVGASILAPGLGFAEKDPIVYPELKTASAFSRVLQTITGITPVSSLVANRLLKRELRRHVKGDLQSRVTLFSGTDLLGRKARDISISGKNVLVDDYIPLTEFSFQNESDMPLYASKGSRPILLRPVRFKVSATMTEADMNRLLTSEKGRKLLTGMKVTIPPFGPQFFDMINPSVTLENGRFSLASVMNTQGSPIEDALPIKVSGKIAPDKSSLSLSDLDLQIEGFRNTKDIEQLIENYFSELVDLNHLKVDRHKVKIAIEKSDVVNHRLNLEATVTVEPERKALQKVLKPKS
ncbi:MAG: hypothetical protein K0Q50_2585 [Vampirovibrio sp.]|nr:hypothetical protein [Vampirovibrio sp.]